VLAWSERPDGGLDVVRVIRVASDGSVLDAAPVDALTARSLGAFAVAADAASIVVVYTERDARAEATAVRVVRLPG
jgi:hypothetical protein